jgi:predicted DNA-binding antitoxin AbrB/MazE fold protein
MSLEIEAVYENGVLKPDVPLPLKEKERVTVSIKQPVSQIRQSAGLIRWTGDQKDLEQLLGPDNHPWEKA